MERLAAYAQGKGYGASTVRQEIRLVRKLSSRRPTLAIDIGGNIGEYSAELRAQNPQLEIHIFEPAQANLAKLKERFEGDRLLTLVPLAVSDRGGPATLFSDMPGSGLASLTQRRLEHLDIPFDVKEAVQTVRFEDYWKGALDSRPLDWVKIDIEGHELAALDGFGKAIDSTHALQFEFGGCNVDTRTYFRDFWYFLEDHRFDVHRVTPFGGERLFGYAESDEFFSTTNYVAIRRA